MYTRRHTYTLSHVHTSVCVCVCTHPVLARCPPMFSHRLHTRATCRGGVHGGVLADTAERHTDPESSFEQSCRYIPLFTLEIRCLPVDSRLSISVISAKRYFLCFLAFSFLAESGDSLGTPGTRDSGLAAFLCFSY